MEEAIEIDKKQAKLPKEYVQIINLSKRLNKVLGKILVEQITYIGPEAKKIAKETENLHDHLSDFLELQSSHPSNEDISDSPMTDKKLKTALSEHHAEF